MTGRLGPAPTPRSGFDYDARRSSHPKEATLARAKRTERAEARRRYREAMAAQAEGTPDPDIEVPAAAKPQRQPKAVPGTTIAVAERPSFFATFRAAVRPADVPGDLRALPRLLISPAVLVPMAIVAASTAIALIPDLSDNVITSFVVQLFLQPPALAIAFIGGWLAPRGSWLIGGIVSIAAVIGYAIIVARYGTEGALSPTGPLLITIVLGIAFGISVGAFAGFYKRWLAMMTPARQQRPRPSSKSSSRPRPK